MKWVKNAIIAAAILAVVLFVSKTLGGMSTKEEIKEDNIKLQVRVMDAKLDTVALPLTVYGRLNAANRADLLAEVSGTFKGSDREFLEGTRFSKGETIIRLDDSEARANAMSVKGNFINALLAILPDLNQDYSSDYARFKAYYDNTSLEKSLEALPKAEGKLEKFLIARGIQGAFFQAKSAEERLAKFSIKAPFNGVVAAANVKPGNLVSPGRALGTFVNTDSYELRSAVSLRYADQLSVGQKVAFSSPDIAGDWTGTISRIAPVVDAASQSINIITTVRGSALREGMYLTGQIQGIAVMDALKLPSSMVFDNKYMYMIESDSVLAKNEVEVVEWLDNEVIVRGVANVATMVNEPTLKAAAGLVVVPVK